MLRIEKSKAAFTSEQNDDLEQALKKGELDTLRGREKVAGAFSEKTGKSIDIYTDEIYTWYRASCLKYESDPMCVCVCVCMYVCVCVPACVSVCV